MPSQENYSIDNNKLLENGGSYETRGAFYS